MKIHQLPLTDVLASVRSQATGLSSSEAAARLKEYGPNRVEAAARQPWPLRLAREFTHLFSLILWIAAGLAFLADQFAPDQGMARVAIAVVLVILISGLFSFWQEARVERTLAAMQNLLPDQVEVWRDGHPVTLSADQVVPGDVLHLAQGDNVPADCRLLEAFGLRINRATLTGESRPISADPAPSQVERPLESPNLLLFAGTALIAGQGKAVVFATGAHTEFGRIAKLTQGGKEEESPLRREIAHLSQSIAYIALTMGLVLLALGGLLGIPFWRDVMLALGIIIALVPEGLLPTLTLSLVLAAQRLAKRQVLIRHLPSVETLGSVTVICTDKTGTLTENRMAVRDLYLDNRRLSLADFRADTSLTARHGRLLQAARYCQDLTESPEGNGPPYSGDPLEVALAEMAGALGIGPATAPRLDEFPFDSERMCQSVVYGEGDHQVLYCKGAREVVLPRCTRHGINGTGEPLTPADRQAIIEAEDAMAREGLRVIALAWRSLPPGLPREQQEAELEFCGLVGMADPPRAEVDQAIATCHRAGIRVIMVTGDHPRTAQAIAQQIGLCPHGQAPVITGEQLQHLGPVQLQQALDEPHLLFARVAADQKMRIVEALKAKGEIVAVTGDRVNDAPALRAAHIGIGMGRSGTDVAKEAADMVLLDDHFASIVNAIEEGRAVFQNIRKFLTYVLVHNVAELFPSLAFALFPIPLPLTPVQALGIDMGSDSLTALGLGVEKGNPERMAQPPRSRHERLLSPAVSLRAYAFLGLIEAAAALSAFFFVLAQGGWHYGDALGPHTLLYRQATTACLAAIVTLQVANVFLCRSALRSIFTTGVGGNPLILWGVVVEVVALALAAYTPWGNALFGTAPLPGRVWVFLLPWVAVMVGLEEGRKAWVRHRLRRLGRYREA